MMRPTPCSEATPNEVIPPVAEWQRMAMETDKQN